MLSIIQQILRFFANSWNRLVRLFTGGTGTQPSPVTIPGPGPSPVPIPGPSPTPTSAISVDILTNLNLPQAPRVRLRYRLFHPQGDPLTATIRYSANNGQDWHIATAAPSRFGGEALTDLATDPLGVDHLFVWDMPADLGSTEQQGLKVKFEVGPPPDGVAESVSFSTTVHLPPSIQIDATLTTRHSRFAQIKYTLQDPGSDLCRILCEWSDDQGANWHAANEAPGQGSDGTIGLRTTPEGVEHLFVWDAAADLNRNQATGLSFRAEALDTQSGGIATSSTFSIGVNTPPEIALTGAPSLLGGGRVLVPFTLIDADIDLVDLTVTFRSPNAPQPRPASSANLPWASGATSVIAYPTGNHGLYVWDAAADLIPGGPEAQGLTLKFEVADADVGNSVETQAFDIPATQNGRRVLVTYPTGGTLSSPSPIHVELVDVASAPMDISMSWSSDGVIWNPVSPTPGSGIQTLTGLTTSPDGVEHVLLWDIVNDIGLSAAQDYSLRVQEIGAPATEAITIHPLDIISNEPVEATINFPTPGTYSGKIAIQYALSDSEDDFCSIEVRYSTDNGIIWHGATPALNEPQHSGQSGLSSSFVGTDHIYVWDSAADLGTQGAQNVRVRVQPADSRPGRAGLSQAFSIVAVANPIVRFRAPGPGITGRPTGILYELVDSGTLPLSVLVEYSVAGAPYLAATEAVGVGSEGVTGLAANSAGALHFFGWNSQADLGSNPPADTTIRISATNATGTGSAISPIFTPIQGYVGAPVLLAGITRGGGVPGAPGGGLRLPDVLLVHTSRQPSGGSTASQTGMHLAIPFRVRHPDGQRINVALRYRTQGGSWSFMSPAANSHLTTNLLAPPSGTDYEFVWDAIGDLGEGQFTVELQATSHIGALRGNTDQSHPIRLTLEAAAQAATAPTIPDLSATTLEKAQGDQQFALIGYRLRRPLVVECKAPDANGNLAPLVGVPVKFRVDSAQAAWVEFIDAFGYSLVTDDQGKAGTLVRIKPGTPAGTITFYASIDQAGTTEIPFVVTVGQAILDKWTGPDAPGPIEYGESSHFRFRIIYPGRPSEADLATVREHPLRFTVTADNAELDQNEFAFVGGSDHAFEFNLVPKETTAGIPPTQVTLTVRSTSDPTIQPWSQAYQVEVSDNTSTWDHPINRPPSRRRHLKLRFDATTPASATPGPASRRGWPLMTLTEPFKVVLKDEQHQVYARMLGPNDPVSGLGSITAPPLEIDWRGDGTFRTSENPSAATVDRAPVTQQVWFTPKNHHGPWKVHARFSGYVYNPHALTFAWTNTAGGPVQRDRLNGLVVSMRRTFLIAGPTETHVEEVTTPNSPITKLECGHSYKVVATGLSPIRRPANHIGLDVKNYEKNYGLLHQIWSGYPHDFRARIALNVSNRTRIDSETFGLIQGRPNTTPTGRTLATIPGGETHFEIPIQTLELPVAKRSRHRRLQNDWPSRQENASGTTPRVGILDTVNPLTGEFIYETTDLERPSRFDSLSLERVYNSHLDEDDDSLPTPLGPGWTLGWDAFFEGGVSNRRLCDDQGRIDTFDRRPPSDSTFLLRTNRQLSTNRNAYAWITSEHDTLHFDVDGYLRWIEDHRGGKIELLRDAGGRLLQVLDMMEPGGFGPSPIANPAPHRRFTFRYFEAGVAGVQDAWVGRLREVEDWSGAKVNFHYYAPGDSGGPPGYLKQVKLPPAPTWNGTASVSQRRTETYEYIEENSKWYLKRIRDGLNRIVVENDIQQGRVTTQRCSATTNEVTIQWDATTRMATVQSRTGARYRYRFPQVCTPLGAAPNQVEEEVDGNWQATTYEHDHHGRRVKQTDPTNNIGEFIYAEPSTYDTRKAGNLEHVRLTPAQGDTRQWTYKYDRYFNQVQHMVGPNGHKPGVDPALHRISSYVDGTWESSRGDVGPGGNVVSYRRPRSLNVAPFDSENPFSNAIFRWIWAKPVTTSRYNAYGKVSFVENTQGVVTAFRYYPEVDWNGQSGQTPTTDGGGLLGEIEEDLEDTVRRNRHLPGVTRNSRVTRIYYDQRGNLSSVTDWRGVRTDMDVDALGNLHVITENANNVSGVGSRTRQYVTNAAGHVVRAELYRTGQTPVSGAPRLILNYDKDAHEQVLVTTLTPDQGPALQTAYQRDQTGLVRTFRPPMTIDAPDAEITVDMAPGSRFVDVHEGRSGHRKTSRFSFAADDRVERITLPGNRPVDFKVDRTKQAAAIIDPDGNVEETQSSSNGGLIRHAQHDGTQGANPGRDWPPSTSRVVDFFETKNDDYDRPRRFTLALIQPQTASPSALASPYPISRLPDDIGPETREWPPIGSSPWQGGNFTGGAPRSASGIDYDVFGNPTRQVEPVGNYTLFRRNAFGQVIQTFRSLGGAWGDIINYHYANDGSYVSIEELSVRPGSGGLSRLSFWAQADFDALGRTLRLMDGQGRARYMTHDENGAVTQVADSSGSTSVGTFGGNPIYSQGNPVNMDHDAFGRPTTTRIPIANNTFISGGAIEHALHYKPGGLLDKWVDGQNKETTYHYYDDGKLREIRYPVSSAGGVRTPTARSHFFSWHANTGQLETQTDGRGVTLRFVYGSKQLTRIESVLPSPVPGSTRLDFKSDGNGAITEIKDPDNDIVVQWKRDNLSQPYEETQQHGTQLSIDIDITQNYRDQRSEVVIAQPINQRRAEVYDILGRLSELWIDSRRVAEIQYVHTNRRNRLGIGSLNIVELLDSGDFLETLRVTGLASSGTLEWIRRPDKSSRCQNQTQRHGSLELAYSWERDEAGRVRHERFTPAGSGGNTVIHTERLFDADNVIRRKTVTHIDNSVTPATTQVVDSQTYEREERGRITKVGTQTIDYDQAGGLTFDGSKTYTYDSFQRLIEVQVGGQMLVRYEYDGLHRIAKRIAGTITEHFIYEGDKIIAIIVSGQVTEWFAWGARPGELWEAHIGGTKYRTLRSPQGSIAALIDDQDQIAEVSRYDLDGKQTLLDAQWQERSTGSSLCRFGFQGHFRDDYSGLVWFGSRWYSPTLGQFLTPDRQGRTAGANFYGLCRGDTVTWMDPYGRDIGDAAVGTLKFGGGVLWGLVEGVVVEPIKTVWDWYGNWIDIAGSVTGLYNYRHRNVSGAGRLAQSTNGAYGKFLYQLGAGIVGTPGRIIDAGGKGDWFEVGREASIFVPFLKTPARFALNRAVGRLPNAGRLGRLRTGIRNAQINYMANGFTLQIRGYRIPIARGLRQHEWFRRFSDSLDRPGAPLAWAYDARLFLDDGARAVYDHTFNMVTLSESVFRQPLFRGRLPLFRQGSFTPRNLDFWQPIRGIDIYLPKFNWLDRTSWAQLLKGSHPAGTMFHEAWHAVQHNRFPNFWRRSVADVGKNWYMARGTRYLLDWREITHAGGRGIPGAFDVQFLHGPMHPMMHDLFWGAVISSNHPKD